MQRPRRLLHTEYTMEPGASDSGMGTGDPWKATLMLRGSVAGRWQEAVGNLISVPGGRAK